MNLKNFFGKRILIIFYLFMICNIIIMPQFLTQQAHQIISPSIRLSNPNNGQILFSPTASKKTYLLNKTGTIDHTWTSEYYGLAVYMVKDKSILRTIVTNSEHGGGVQKFRYDGSLIWQYDYYVPNQYQCHHDIEPLPNGNVLMLVSELKTRTEVINAGRNPSQIPDNTIEFDYIIEVKPTSPTTGEIVWEWHSWNHLIQEYDRTKANYGTVANHPELLDINFATTNPDWLHCNTIDYNEHLNQILVCSRHFSEIWVIDHSTTTQQAAGHTGGNSGKGGDLLYRWGNPRTYKRGTTADQKLFGPHDSQWIPLGYPGEGNMLIFNNGLGRYYSSVDEIIPPVNSSGQYYLDFGAAYGPTGWCWSYTATPTTSFFAEYMSGCQRLPNGNTLICDGPAGHFFEVTPDKETVWEYSNTYPSPVLNDVFKIQYIPPPEPPLPNVPDLQCKGSFQWYKVKAGTVLSGNFYVKNIGGPESFLNWTIESYPSWGTWTFTPESGVNLQPKHGTINVMITLQVPEEKNAELEGYIRVVNQNDPSDFELIPVTVTTPRYTFLQMFIDNFLRNHPHLYNLLALLEQMMS